MYGMHEGWQELNNIRHQGPGAGQRLLSLSADLFQSAKSAKQHRTAKSSLTAANHQGLETMPQMLLVYQRLAPHSLPSAVILPHPQVLDFALQLKQHKI